MTGLAEHLRNLMVSIDPITHKLLDVSEGFRQRFAQQSTACGLPLIMKYLEIASDSEYRYRDANNKRLFVEVCLMKLAAVMKNLQQQQAG